jgi:multidrug efflux pump subunit AcrB
MPDEVTQTPQPEGQAQAPSPTEGGQVESSGQAVEAAPEVSSDPETLKQSYEELRQKFNQRDQELVALRKDSDTLKYLKNDSKFVDWAQQTYGGNTQTQNPPASETEIGYDDDIPQTRAELSQYVAQEVNKQINHDPLISKFKDQSVDLEFQHLGGKYTDITNYRQKMIDYQSANPGVNMTLEELYRQVKFDDLVSGQQVQQQNQQSIDAKKNASTVSPGMTSTVTPDDRPRTVAESFHKAKKQLGID